MNYVEIAFVLSLLCMSVYVITREGMIFEFVRNWFTSLAKWIGFAFYLTGTNQAATLSKYIRKPFFECPPCMASVWGTIFYLTIYHNTVLEWLVCVLICSLFNKVIYAYVE